MVSINTHTTEIIIETRSEHCACDRIIVHGVAPELIEAGKQGIAGTTLDDSTRTRKAGEAISAVKVVYQSPSDEKVYKADNLDNNTRDTVLGISLTSAILNQDITIKTFGEVENSGWNWDVNANKNLYLGTNGNITQVPPASGFSLRLGFILSSKKIWFDLSERVILS
jgi:hypothetical protein